MLLWSVQQAVLVGAWLTAAAPGYVKLAAALVLLAHAYRHWPRWPRTLVRAASGRWAAAPLVALDAPMLAPGSEYTGRWARLRFVGRGGAARAELVWADELEPGAWRRLRLDLGEGAGQGRA